MVETKFLSKESVLLIHKIMVDKFGGSHGIRDEGLLDSALSMPESGFGNSYFHESLFDKASAYLYHLIKNHPFIDGNKRVGFACTEVFLRVNGYKLQKDKQQEIYEFVIKLASSNSISKEQVSIFLEKNSARLLS